MKPIHKLRYTLIASVALLLAGCGGSSNTLSEAEQAKMQRAETQTTALKTAYDAAVAALETLEDDTSDATRAEVDDAQAKLDALKAAITAAVDVADEVKAMYPADAIETRLTAARGSAAPALADEQARMERAETQTAALKTAHDAAVAALETLEDDTSDATRVEVDDAQAKLDALKAAITAAMDVSDEVKAMYPAQALETRLTTARGSAAPALADEQAKMARAETQTTALKMSYDEARAALDKLKDNTDDATQEEVDDAKAKLEALKAAITAAVDVSEEVKAMYPAEALEAELTKTEQLASFGLTMERLRMAASKAIEDAGKAIMKAGEAIEGADGANGAKQAIEGAETAVEGLDFISIQTGSVSTVAQDVKEARKAYDDAKKKYDAAKKAYDMAREKHDTDRDAADTLKKANALKVAADAAKTAADDAKMKADDAKTAADEAKMKANTDVETAKMTSLRYENGAYRIGDTTSINPTAIGKRKTTYTEDGETRTTGFEAINMRSDSLAFREYDAGPPVVGGRPAIESRELMIGGKYDTADDDTRLRLITHYITNTKEIGLYGILQSEEGQEYKKKPTDDAPYGTFTDSNGQEIKVTAYRPPSPEYYYLVKNSAGQRITGETIRKENLHGLLVESDSEPLKLGPRGDIYYYYTGSFTQFLHLVRAATDFDGTDTYFFRKIVRYHASDDTPILFPESKAYEHMNYGIWAMLDEDGESPTELGIGFVRGLTEDSMTTDLPTGSATYKGNWVANIRGREQVGADLGGAITEHQGRADVTAQFDGERTVSVHLYKGIINAQGAVGQDLDLRDGIYGTLAKLEGTITDGTSKFEGTKVTNVLTGVSRSDHFGNLGISAAGSTGDDPDYTGTFSGAFFGPKGAEVGGVFDFTTENKRKYGEFRGAFGAARQPEADDSSE